MASVERAPAKDFLALSILLDLWWKRSRARRPAAVDGAVVSG